MINKLKGKNKIIPVVIILIILAMAYYFNFKVNHEFLGEVEGVIVSNSTEVSGKILESPIQLGSSIKKGDIIARIDDTNQKYVVEQLSLNLQKANLSATNSKVGMGTTADNNYSAAVANYESTVAIAEKAKQDYNNAKKLYKELAISQEVYDNAKLEYETAVSKMQASKAQVNNATDKTAGNVADIDVAILESQLKQQKDILDKYTIVAACDGIVMSKNYKEGDVVSAGFNIADISSDTERYAVIYFPEKQLEDIKYNQKATVFLGETSVEAKIKYIDIKAQYTPKDMQSTANRNQESVRVKLLLPKNCNVNIGQKIKVKF